MKSFSEGEFYCLKENGLFHSFKILQIDPAAGKMLVRSYWPEAESPNEWHSPELSVQRACEEISIEKLEKAEKGMFEPVTETDLKEIQMFTHIKEGLAKRISMLPEIMERANACFQAESWMEAIHLFTEAASFARNNPEIFLKRGECYHKLGMESEAKADFNHAANLAG